MNNKTKLYRCTQKSGNNDDLTQKNNILTYNNNIAMAVNLDNFLNIHIDVTQQCQNDAAVETNDTRNSINPKISGKKSSVWEAAIIHFLYLSRENLNFFSSSLSSISKKLLLVSIFWRNIFPLPHLLECGTRTFVRFSVNQSRIRTNLIRRKGILSYDYSSFDLFRLLFMQTEQRKKLNGSNKGKKNRPKNT